MAVAAPPRASPESLSCEVTRVAECGHRARPWRRGAAGSARLAAFSSGVSPRFLTGGRAPSTRATCALRTTGEGAAGGAAPGGADIRCGGAKATAAPRSIGGGRIASILRVLAAANDVHCVYGCFSTLSLAARTVRSCLVGGPNCSLLVLPYNC